MCLMALNKAFGFVTVYCDANSALCAFMQFFIEPAEEILQAPKLAPFVKLQTPSSQPFSINETEERERQQIMEENKLLADAGINVAEINTPEERQNTLVVLRISLPTPASSAEPVSASKALEETQPFGESSYPANTLVEDDDMELKVTPALTSLKTAQSSSVEKPTSSSNAETKVQQPQTSGSRSRTWRRRVQKKTMVEGNEEVDVTDSCHTSDSTSSPPTKPSRTRTTESGGADSSDIGNLSKAPLPLTVRSSLNQIDYSSDSDQCASSIFAGKCNEKGGVSGKDGSSDSDPCTKPLQKRVLKKLTGDQMQKVHDILHSMLSKSKSLSQPDMLSPVEETEETTVASQDLFKTGEEEAEPLETSPTFPSQPTPGNHPIPSQDMVSRDEDPSDPDMDVETIPPDSPVPNLTLLDTKEEVDNDDEDDNSLSQEFPVQTTQPMSVAVERADWTREATSSAKQGQTIPEREEEARGEAGYSEEEETDDKKPLPHDNWFCWSHSQPSQPLQRRYRKRKRLQEETKPYFCPSPKVDPASYTKVIVQLFDIYFAKFTKLQSLLKNKLPWGNPIYVGMQNAGTLDVKRKGEFSIVPVDAGDDDDDFASAPAVKKRTVGEGVQTRTGLRTFGGRELRHVNPLMHATTGAVYSSGGSMHKGVKEASVFPMPVTSSMIEEATQPNDLDDELPDLSLESSASQRAKSMEAKPTTSATRMETDEDRTTMKRSASPFSSQSSNSRLDENGDLYCTQLPRCTSANEHQSSQFVLEEEDMIGKESSSQPKRRVTERSQTRRDGGDGTVRKTRRQAEIKQPKTETSIHVRKRKQVESASINLDDVSDDEIYLPQKRKREMSKTVVDPKTQDQVNMSIIVDTNKSRALVRVPGGLNVNQINIQHKMSGSGRNIQGALEGSESRYFQDTKRTGSHVCSGPAEVNPLHVESGITDDDDSVLFVSLVHTGQGSQDQRLEQQQATKQKVLGQEKPEREEQTECPLCGKSFPLSTIEQHASSCGEEQDEDPLPHATTTNPLFPRGLMSRRPLHTNTRDDLECPYCDVLCGGKGAKERHMEKCIQQMTQHQHEIEMGTRGRVTRASTENTGSSMLKPQGVFGRYKIPKIGEPSRRQATATKQLPSNLDDIENVPSDDSDGDPTYTLTKDDVRQEKKDLREDGDNDLPTTFKPVSKLTDSTIDFKNQFPGKGRTRQSKLKDL